MNEIDPPNFNDIVIRFSMRTPFWPLSFSYGIFGDPSSRMYYASLDHYIGYHMLARLEDRDRVVTAPNGYISYRELGEILSNGEDSSGNPVIVPNWTANRDAVLDQGLRFKYGQSSFLREMLVRTHPRRIFDVSREEERHWCYCNGNGDNAHGLALMRLRDRIIDGENIGLAHGV